MKRHDDATDRAIEAILGVIFKAIPIVAIALPAFFISLLFWPLKGLLTKTWQLEKLAVRYARWHEGLAFLKWCAFVLCVVSLYCLLFKATANAAWLERYVWTLGSACMAMLSGLGYSIIDWITSLQKKPHVQQRVAGMAAEDYVKNILHCLQSSYPGSCTLHAALLAFKDGDTEFSVELDHLLVTRHNCYLIETKYRNATVIAAADAPEWKTHAPDGREGTMRNALAQAKNAARVLEKQFILPLRIVPIVAIHGMETRIVDGPANVVRTDQLPDVIAAFEQVETAHVLDPSRVMATISMHIATSEGAMQRHIERAEVAKRRAAAKALVSAASR